MAAPTGGTRGFALGALPAAVVVVPIAFVQTFGTLGFSRAQGMVEQLTPMTFVLLLTGPLLLLGRRRFPLSTLVGVVVVALVYFLLRNPPGPVFLSLAVASFNAVLHGPRLAAWLTAWLGTGVIVATLALTREDYGLGMPGIGANAAWLTSILVVAEIVKARRERVEQAEAARAEQAKRQASEERIRIARDVHDVLAHHVSLINVQSGVALHLIDTQPEQVRDALVTIKQSSKEVLVELRNILGVLRDVDREDGPPKQPTASLDQLDGLLDRMRSAGLPVSLEVTGERRPLPNAVDGAALRIVQESLTNTYRHAGPTQATVRLAYLAGELRVEIDDNGRGEVSAVSTMGSGAGLTGMRQRAEALDGAFRAGPKPNGGFLVSVTLPTEIRAEGGTT